MTKFYVPSTGPDDWQTLLGDPVKHWRTGYSAKTLAHCWEGAGGLVPVALLCWPLALSAIALAGFSRADKKSARGRS